MIGFFENTLHINHAAGHLIPHLETPLKVTKDGVRRLSLRNQMPRQL
jgi:hypothetical protein